MESFGKKLRECREAKKMSQSQVAKLLGAHHSIIGRYERDEVKPTIDVVRNLAKALDTTVGYLLGEAQNNNVLKDPAMMKRLNELDELPEQDRFCILYALDGLLRDAKTRQAYAS